MFVHAYRCNESLSMRIFWSPNKKVHMLAETSFKVAPVEFADLSSTAKEESSASIRERVQKARDIQNERFKGTSITCNARITSDILHEVCPVTDEASKLLENVFDRLGLSARAYDRILKVARTVADMDGAKVIDKKHIAMAVQYRSLDRKYWNG